MSDWMTNRRDFLKTMGAGAASLAVAGPAAFTETGAQKRPNILLILVDDMGWSDIGCYGGEVNTPNLDFLASQGVQFTQFHNTAKCFPSRACLLTGLYAQQVGMGKRAGTLENCVTLGEVLQTAGYRTWMSGKHHGKDNPFDRGFDRYYGLRDGASNHFNPGDQRDGEGAPARKEASVEIRKRLQAAGRQAPGYPRTWCIDDDVISPFTPEPGFYSTDAFTDQALDYLDGHEGENAPFFLYLSYTAPHDPLMAWPEDIAKYRGRYLAGYEKIRTERYARQVESGLIDETFPLSEPTHDAWNTLSDEEKDVEDQKMAVYCAMIDRVDQNIGRVLDRLRAQGELDNTVILFASDNGCSSEQVPEAFLSPGSDTGEIGSMTRWSSLTESWANVSNTPFRYYKNWSHKGGSCTPLIAFWPEGLVSPGRVSHDVGHFVDFMPTLAELAGATYPETFNGSPIPPLVGQSLLPILRGEAYERQAPVFWQWSDGKAVRHGDYRLVSGKGGPWELYDVLVDRTETNDLAATMPATVRQLSAKYDAWAERVGADITPLGILSR
jgi:arylsulfatase A-like enzyme